MNFQNAVRKLSVDWQARAMLPTKESMAELRPGFYVRLQAEGGSYLWARVLRRNGRELILVADDSLPSGALARGDEVCCSTGCVFAVV